MCGVYRKSPRGAKKIDKDVTSVTFDTLPHFKAGWKKLTREQQAAFRAVVLEAFEPNLKAPGQFRPGLRVMPVAGHPGLFEMTWTRDGPATFSYSEEREPGQPHVVWRQIVRITTPSDSPSRNLRCPARLAPSAVSALRDLSEVVRPIR